MKKKKKYIKKKNNSSAYHMVHEPAGTLDKL